MLDQLVKFFSTYANAILAFAVVAAGIVYLARLGRKISHIHDALSTDIANVSKDLAEVKSLIGTLITSSARQNERTAHLEG